ncbi:MAG: hypothetical protein HYR48_05350 [Gemmatimonadetes bacterium]|nr:hypothetical protein [Gemmatimonadota bacterium]
MCLCVFVASDHELPLIAFAADRRQFNVKELSPLEEPVRVQFSKPHVRYLGSHTDCACGFSPETEPNDSDRQRSVSALITYLDQALRLGPVELFVCWERDYAAPPERSLDSVIDELAARHDWLKELTFVRLAGRALDHPG